MPGWLLSYTIARVVQKRWKRRGGCNIGSPSHMRQNEGSALASEAFVHQHASLENLQARKNVDCENYGRANTYTCPAVLGLSSGVTRSVAFATPDGPVATDTYCLPSTENVIG
jgi:hypothetical protein